MEMGRGRWGPRLWGGEEERSNGGEMMRSSVLKDGSRVVKLNGICKKEGKRNLTGATVEILFCLKFFLYFVTTNNHSSNGVERGRKSLRRYGNWYDMVWSLSLSLSKWLEKK